MALLPAELKWYKSETVDDSGSNGGEIDLNAIVLNNQKNNYLPDITADEVLASLTRYRKLWLKVENDDDLQLGAPIFYMSLPSTGGDDISIMNGITIPLQGNITTQRRHGGFEITAIASEGDTQITIDATSTDFANLIQTGDTIVVLKRGQYEEIHENVTVVDNGATATVTLDTNDALTRDYAIGDVLASACELGKDVTVEINSQVEFGGTFDWNDLEVDFLGAVTTSWQITMGEGSAFTAESPDEGSFLGDQTVDFAPQNPNAGNRPYFIIRSTAWTDFGYGDYISFDQVMPVAPIWVVEKVYNGITGVTNNNEFAIGIIGG